MKSQLDHFTQKHQLSRFLEGKVRSIAVASGKGGVGKSTVCVNLAIALAQLGHRILLLDGDPGMADLHILLGKTPERNWGDFIKGNFGLTEIIEKGLHQVDLIHGFSGMEQSNLGTQGAIEQLVKAVGEISNQYDLILVDVGAGVGESAMYLTTTVEKTVLIINPEFTAIADAYGAFKTICKWNPLQKVSISVNRVETEAKGRETFNHFKMVSEKFLNRQPDLEAVLRESVEVPQALYKQIPAIKSFPNCKWSQDIQKWADKIHKDLSQDAK